MPLCGRTEIDMKKVLFLLSTLIIISLLSISVFAKKIIRMTIGDEYAITTDAVLEKLDAAPIIRDGRTMLPVRFVAEHLGATVGWDSETSSATITTNTIDIKIAVGAKVAYVNGKEVALDAPAFIENSRTYMPVRFIAESLGAKVEWDGATSTAVITLEPEKTITTDDIILDIYYGEATVSGYNENSTATEITIPEEVDGYKVVAIGRDAFSFHRTLKCVNLPQTVTSIGRSAFDSCFSLENINLPNSITFIDEFAFVWCTSLESVFLPKNLSFIGDNAFYECNILSFSVPDDNDSYCDINGVLFSKDKKTLVRYPAGKVDPLYTIPDSVTSIANGAFSGCTSLKKIHLSDKLNYIGEDAFSDCTSLTTITIPDSVTYIGNGAFSGCKSLYQVYLPQGITAINDETFFGCTSLTNIGLTKNVTSIGYRAFAFTGLKYITIPSGVKTIGEKAFYACDSLQTANLYHNVVSIGKEAFRDCSSLSTVYLTNTLTTIDEGAFLACTSLKEISLPSSVTSIGIGAFDNCDGIVIVCAPGSYAEAYARYFRLTIKNK